MPPPRPGLVAREGLLARLQAGAGGRLTLVAAPPGSGKTTLLAAWSASGRDPRPFAWLSLDRGDGDPARFWSSVLEALRTVTPGLGAQAEDALRASGTTLTGHVVPLLVNDLVARGVHAVLVLDDLHAVEDPDVHASLAYLLDRLPPGMHVVVGTRSDPPLPLARLRVRGELAEVRGADLRFSADEAAGLLRDGLGLDLAREDVEALVRRTEGWAAALQLAGLSLRGGRATHDVVATFAGDDHELVDFLCEEVLADQPGRLRRFLLHTSVLDRLSAPLCDAVTADDDGRELLDELDRRNLFLVPLDRRRSWYRYHHLFGELLRHRLRVEEPGREAELHGRAAAWCRGADLVPEAIAHSLAAGDGRQAAALVAAHWAAFFNRGRQQTVSGWLDALPAATVRSDRALWLARAWVWLDGGRPGDVDAWLRTVEDAAAPPDPAIAAWAPLLRAVHAFKTGDVGEAARRAAAVDAGEAGPFHRTVAWLMRGVTACWLGDALAARAALEEAAATAEADGNALGTSYALGYLAALEAEDGRPGAAERLLERAAAGGAGEHFDAVVEHAARATVLLHRARPADAAAEATRAACLARRGAGLVEAGWALLVLAEAHAAAGADEAAMRALAEARAVTARCPDPARLGVRVAAAGRRVARRPGGAAPDTLSERELEVLRLLRTPLSQREIADALVVSVNTVKTHVRNIFLKLGADSRQAALDRARDLALL